MDEKFLLIVVEESDSSVGFYDSDTGSEIYRVKTGLWPHELEVSKDGSKIYVTNFGIKDYDERIGKPGSSISVISIQHFCEIDRLYTFRNKKEYLNFRGPHSVKLTPDGRQLYVNVETEDRLLIYNLDEASTSKCFTDTITGKGKFERNLNSKPDHDMPLPQGTHNILFSPDGKYLFVTAGTGGVTEIDVATKKATRAFHCNGSVRGLTYTVDKKQFIASASNEVCLVNPHTFQITRQYGPLQVKQVLNSVATPDGKYILSPAVWEGQVLVINIETGDVEKRIIVGADPIHILIHPNGKSAFVTSGRSKYLTEIDLETFLVVKKIKTKGGPNGLACVPYVKPPARKKLRFGTCLPLSGPSSEEGQDLRLGYQFWEEKVNDSGGIAIGDTVFEIEIVYKDTFSSTEKETVQRLTKELIEDENVSFFLGNYPSPANLYAGEVANENKIPFITASGAAEDIYNKGYRFVFGIMSSSKSFLEGALRLLEKTGSLPKTVCFISCDDIAAKNDAITTAEIARSLGIKILIPPSNDTQYDYEIIEPGIIIYKHLRNNFETIVKAVSISDPELLIHTGHLGEAIEVIRSSKEENFSPSGFAFSVGPALPGFSQVLSNLSLNMLGAAMWSSVQESYGHDPFVTPGDFELEFYNRYSKKPSYLSAGSMACGLVYEEAFRRAKSTNALKIINTLRSDDFEMETFYSHIAFDKRGLNANRPLIIIQLREVDGEIKHIPVWPKEIAGDNYLVWPFPGWS